MSKSQMQVSCIYTSNIDAEPAPPKRNRGRPAKGGIRTTVRLSRRNHAALMDLAKLAGVDLSNLVDAAVTSYVRRQTKKLARLKVLGVDGEAPLRNTTGRLCHIQPGGRPGGTRRMLRRQLAEAEAAFGPSHARTRELAAELERLEAGTRPPVSRAPESKP